MKCPKCGSINGKNNFCTNCGTPLDLNKTNKAQQKKRLPAWAIVLICVFGSMFLIVAFNNNETSHINNQTNIEEVKDESSSGIKINIKSDMEQNIKIGEKKKIEYSISPWSERKRKITWESSDDKVVHVYENGEILGMGSGTAIITATIDNIQSSIKVNVASLSYDKEGGLKEIANVYYLNEARGNSNYFDKMVKVTGIVDRVNVDDSVIFNTGVTIWIKEKGAKYDLACNNDHGIVGVSDINRGDKISVVGKMDTMVGSSLHMKECEIYK